MSRIKKHKIKRSIERAPPKKPFLSKQAIWTIILGGLMVASVFGIMFSGYNSGSSKEVFGDYTFQQTTTGWVTDINGKPVTFTYLPSDLNIIIGKDVSDALLQSRAFYITFNPNAKSVEQLELLRYNLGTTLQDVFGKYSLAGISEPNELYTQPIVDCLNATQAMPVINIIEANSTAFSLESDCITIEVPEYSTAAIRDSIVYSLLGLHSQPQESLEP
ncbi:hypothetical protein KY363_07205 [Candidatus Woesearchaeota archaeon]|nr:hypothetical protein [Candidatus Woesearchaeota archaeon]